MEDDNSMRVYIKDIACYLPKTVLTNEDLLKDFPEWSVEKVAGKIGVSERHITRAEETATDMAVAAAEQLFAQGVDRACVDFVLLCTQSGDYYLPSSACIVQHRLGLSTKCGAFDFNLGCSGYEYGLVMAKGLILAGVAKNVLLLTAETYTKYIHPKDKGNRTIFGDGASATLVSTEGFAEIGESVVGTDGSGAENLIVKTGGSRHPQAMNDVHIDDEGNVRSSDHLYMNGTEILNFTLEIVPTLIDDVLAKNGLSKEDINLWVFHQANKYILNFMRRKIRIPEEQFYYYMEHVGNTVSSTIPFALCAAREEGRLHGNVLLAGFGVGYSWGATVIKCE